jgi:tetratricopeptide (TPR) repeat protein
MLERLPDDARAHALGQARGLDLLLPELAAAPGDDPSDGWIERGAEPEQRRRLLFSAVVRCLRAVAGEAGVLLVLDDVHWAGPDALDLLATLVAADGAPAIRLIGAYRHSETVTGGRLGEFVADLARASRIRVVELEPLSDAEAQQLLLQSVSDAEAMQTLLPAIVRRAGGVPFFLVSFVEDLRAGDPASPRLTLPWTVRQVIGQRVLALPESAREPLAVAALVGRVVSRTVLSGVTNRSENELLEVLEAAAAASLLAEDQTGEYRFTHELIRETIEDDLSAGRRRVLHRRIGETLEREGGASSATLALHFSQADDQDRAVRYLVLAGDEARERAAHAGAAESYQQALAYPEQTDLAPLQEKLGDALYLCGRYDEAIRPLECALEHYRAGGDQHSTERVAGRLADVHFRRGSRHELLDRVPELLADASDSGATTAPRERFGRLLFEKGAFRQLLTFGRSLKRLGRTSANLRLLILGERIEGVSLIQLGRLAEGVAILEPALERQLATADRERILEVALVLSIAHLGTGETQRCLTLIRRMLPLAEQLNDPVVTAAHTTVLGAALHLSGDWTGARQHFQQADLLLAGAAPSTIAARTASPRAQLLIWEGSWDDAERLLHAMERDSRTMRIRHVERRVRALYAELDLHHGDPRAALDRLAPLADAKRLDDAAVQLHYILAWAYLEVGDLPRARTLIDRALVEAESTGTWLLGTLALRLRGLIAARQGNADDADHAYQDALRRARTMPFPYGEQRILHAYALLERQRRNHQAATQHLTHALEIANRIGATKDAQHLRNELDGS